MGFAGSKPSKVPGIRRNGGTSSAGNRPQRGSDAEQLAQASEGKAPATPWETAWEAAGGRSIQGGKGGDLGFWRRGESVADGDFGGVPYAQLVRRSGQHGRRTVTDVPDARLESMAPE